MKNKLGTAIGAALGAGYGFGGAVGGWANLLINSNYQTSFFHSHFPWSMPELANGLNSPRAEAINYATYLAQVPARLYEHLSGVNIGDNPAELWMCAVGSAILAASAGAALGNLAQWGARKLRGKKTLEDSAQSTE